MRPVELTPVEIADLLDAVYRHDRGGDGIGLLLEERTVLADYLGCHEDVKATVWEAWQQELDSRGEDRGDAQSWLNVEFMEPCRE